MVSTALAIARRAALLFAFGGFAAHAAVLTLSPQTQIVAQGDIAAVDVLVSGLSAQRIGAYDFWINFDSSVISFLNADAGPGLGQPFDSLLETTLEAGRINIAEVSLLPDLSSLQSGNGDVLLFTLRFSAQSQGISPLSFSENILGVAGGFLGDASGEPIVLAETLTGSITVTAATPPSPPIPEPSSIALMVAGLGALGARCRLRPRN